MLWKREGEWQRILSIVKKSPTVTGTYEVRPTFDHPETDSNAAPD